MRAHGGRGLVRVGQFAAVEPEEGQQAVDVHPAGVGAVVGERELVLLARQGQALDQPHPAVDARQAAAVILDAARDDLPAERGAARRGTSRAARDRRGAERVDVVHEQRAQLRPRGEQAREHAVLEQVGNLEPVADGVQALAGRLSV